MRIHDLATRFGGTDIMAEVMLTLFGMMEKQFIKLRQKRGGEAAMARVDIYEGRPAMISKDDVRQLRADWFGAVKIAKRFNIRQVAVYRAWAV